MEKIGIVTDIADLTQEIIAKYQIAVVPAKLNWPELENFPGENTFQKMRELGKRGIKSFGKTSQPSINDYLDQYNYQLERFDKVICITLTSKLSGGYNSAVQAKGFLEPKKQERVFVVDSLNGSCGQGLIVLEAVDIIKSGKGINEVIEELEKFIPKVHFFVMLEDPKWMEASGRISSIVANLMRKMANAGIRPLLAFKNGILALAGLKIGAKDIPTALFKQFEADTKKLQKERRKIRVAITHGDNLQGAQRLKAIIEKGFKNTEIAFINIINNVVGAPTGPNTLAFAWCEIER
jgi:DegV family protein with EDD domain